MAVAAAVVESGAVDEYDPLNKTYPWEIAFARGSPFC